MAERLIDAEALKHKRVIAIYGNLEQGLEEREVVYVEDIDNAPTIEAKPVVHAHWEGDTCSHCKLRWKENMCDDADDWGYFDPMPDYCCNCGAQMDEEFASDTNVGSKGVKIPVISMEDICRKIMCDR